MARKAPAFLIEAGDDVDRSELDGPGAVSGCGGDGIAGMAR